MSEKQFDASVLVSLSSGIALGNFGIMHECAEQLMGHPIWTHEFAEHDLWQRIIAVVVDDEPESKP